MNYNIFKVGVVGGGTMGNGIAALVARYGLPVVVKEENDECAQKAHKKIMDRFQKARDKQKINDHDLERLQSLVTVTSCSKDLADVQLLIEAIPEKLELKLKVFEEFSEILQKQKGVIMVTNTSCLPVTKIAEATTRPDRVAGMHFFNPPTQMPLVELVCGKYTSEETLQVIGDFAKETLDKKIIRVKDRPGFLVNCLLIPYLTEAVNGIEEARVTPDAIDAEARKHGWKMGPFALLDLVGIDVAVLVAEFLVKSYGDRMKMGTLLHKMLELGRLGDKVLNDNKPPAGFYSNDDSVEPIERVLERLYPNRRTDVTVTDIFNRMMYGVLNEAVYALENEVASKEDIEDGAIWGIAFPSSKLSALIHHAGPLHTVDKMGASNLIGKLEDLEKNVGSRFAPRPLLRKMADTGEEFFGW